MVYEYSKRQDGKKYLAENFRVEEFACKDGSDKVLIDRDLVVILQRIRDHFKQKIDINSGYRTPEYNAKVGGSSGSMHTQGKAADIVVHNVDPLVVGLFAAEVVGEHGGIEIGNGYTHIDTRDGRWRAFTTTGGSNYTTVTDFGTKLKRNF